MESGGQIGTFNFLSRINFGEQFLAKKAFLAHWCHIGNAKLGQNDFFIKAICSKKFQSLSPCDFAVIWIKIYILNLSTCYTLNLIDTESAV